MVTRFPYRSERQCPHCGSYDVKRSRRGGLLQIPLRLLLLRRYRCMECWNSFFAYAWAARVEVRDGERKAA